MSKAQNILIVDDNPRSLAALESILRDEGCTLLKAASGEEALDLLLKHDVALVVLDLQGPGMDGFEVVELMRGYSLTRRLPVLFIADIGLRPWDLTPRHFVGAVDYLLQPLSPDIIQSKVRFLLGLDLQKCRMEEKHRRSQEAWDGFLQSMRTADASSLN